MLYHVVFAFVIPWIVGLWLYKKHAQLVLAIAPVFSVISFLINDLGIAFGFWQILPIFDNKSLSSVPYDLGIYPVLSSLLAYLFHLRKSNPAFLIFVMSVFTTGLEVINLYLGKVMYGNGWTLWWTFVSYVIPYSLNYLYYQFLQTKRFIGN